MASLVAAAIQFYSGNERFDDTITDRLNHVSTTALLIVMSLLVTTKQYVGEPIQCWCPKEFSKSRVEYANSICWVKGTYFVPFNKEFIPSYYSSGRKPSVTYYQWVPLILLAQAFFYTLPSLLWTWLESGSGFNLSNFVTYGKKVSSPKVKNDVRETHLNHMTIQLERYLCHGVRSQLMLERPGRNQCTLSLKHIFSRTCFRCFGARTLNYFAFLQIIIKSLYLINSVLQIFFLNLFLNTSFHRYGFDIVMAAFSRRGKGWWSSFNTNKQLLSQQNARFPKVAYCDFHARELGNVQNHSLQCVLTVNLFNEKVFLLLWFWMVFVACCNAFSLLRWTLRNCIAKDRYNYIKNLLLMSGIISLTKKNLRSYDVNRPKRGEGSESTLEVNKMMGDEKSTKQSAYSTPTDSFSSHTKVDDKTLLVMFVSRYLRVDGVLLIHLLNQSTDTLVAMEMAEKLWINFREKYDKTLI